MRILEPQRIRNASERAAQDYSLPTFEAIDFSRPFIHEHYTQLYYTSFYAELSDAQRLRYNQLFGIRVNEQFMMFEHGFTQRVIAKLINHRDVKRCPELTGCLRLMLEEEARHHDMFKRLNKKCLPSIYERRETYFTRLSTFQRIALWPITAFGRHFPFLLWLVLILEEYSVRFSLSLMKEDNTESLGSLEPNVVKAHAAHLRDEARHVHIDARLIDLLLSRAGVVKRHSNGVLFRYLLREVVSPKCSGITVIKHLVSEFPAMTHLESPMIDAIRRQRYDLCMVQRLVDPTDMPLTTLLLGRYPEFSFISDLSTPRMPIKGT